MCALRLLKPGQLVGILAAFQGLVLTAVPYAFSSAPPLDVVEGLVWAPHWLIGTYKHPPLPAWIIEISLLLLRDVILGPYVVGQLCVALTYFFIYRLGRLVVDPVRAAAGAILMAGSYYFTVPTLEFNHNVVQLPLWSGTLLLFAYLRRNSNSWNLWLALGFVGGFGLYGKYTFAILLVILLMIAICDRTMREAFLTPKPYIGIVLTFCVFLPHLIWLFDHQFEPFSYAIDRAGKTGSGSSPLRFFLTQIADHLPIVLVLAVAGISGLLHTQKAHRETKDLNFLRVISFGPILLTLFLFVISASSAKDMWGMPMFTPLGLWLVVENGRQWSVPQIERATLAAMGLIACVGTGFAVEATYPYRGLPLRSNWPMRELARDVDEVWKLHSNKPLEIVGGTPFIAGLASVGYEPHPLVLIGNDLRHSPWINEQQIADKGILFLFQQDGPAPALCGDEFYKYPITLSDPQLPGIMAIVCPPKSTP